jgi:ribosomal protein S18 acetylase RimI-like enzyme
MRELLDISGKYALPKGRLYIACFNGLPAGCAMHPFDESRCEMKRLYVRPTFRKQHIGYRLVEKIINDAADTGYQAILLDTSETMKATVSLYQRFGFGEIAPYDHNPYAGTKYFCLDLSSISTNNKK